MSESPKIKISDNCELRKELFELSKKATQFQLVQWALNCSKHISPLSPPALNFDIIYSGFDIVELWLKNKSTVQEVRSAAFKIHEEARKQNNDLAKTILRAAGQAVATCHMEEHAIVCSDYAIKAVQLFSSNNFETITAERQWQINELKTCNIISGK